MQTKRYSLSSLFPGQTVIVLTQSNPMYFLNDLIAEIIEYPIEEAGDRLIGMFEYE